MLLKRSPEIEFILSLDKYIHSRNGSDYSEYHIRHIEYTKQYAMILNERLGFEINSKKLSYAAYAHDLLKEKGLTNTPDKYKKYPIPGDALGYVRTNLNVLAKYGMEDYFNSSAQYHPLAAAIFLDKELGINDPMIIYPIMFHSCPIMEVYKTLPVKIQNAIDIILLSDKLSSNYLRINYNHSPVKVDLEQLVFGTNGNELHYNLGLYIIRLISEKLSDNYAKEALKYYENRFNDSMPITFKKIQLGGSKLWPERKSPLLKIV